MFRTGQNYAKTQGLGNVDVNKLNTGVNNKAMLQSKSQDLQSFLKDLEENRGRALRTGQQDFQRTNQIGGSNQALAELPTSRFGRGLQDSDNIKRMWEAYHAGQQPSENVLGGAVGGLGGELASSLFGPKKYPSQADREGIQYGPAF